MQRYLLNHLSAGEFIFLLIIFVSCVALLILFLTKKFFSSFISPENTRYIGFFLGTISANYGFVLGFIIVTLWRELYEVKTYIMHEAEYLSLLMHNMSAFPLSVQDEIINGIREYIRIILQEEWPLMALGQSSENAVMALSNLFHIIQSYSPGTKVEEVFYNQFANNLNGVVEFRRKRLEYLDSSLIEVIRFMLAFGLIIILFLVSLLRNRSPKLKVLATVLVSSILSFNLGLAFLLDYPLAGSISAQPTPLTTGILSQFKT